MCVCVSLISNSKTYRSSTLGQVNEKTARDWPSLHPALTGWIPPSRPSGLLGSVDIVSWVIFFHSLSSFLACPPQSTGYPDALPGVLPSSDAGCPIGGVQIHLRLPNTPWHAQCEGKIPSSLPKVPYGTHGDGPHKHYLLIFFCFSGFFLGGAVFGLVSSKED